MLGEIDEVANGSPAGSTSLEDMTLCKALGIAAQDLAAANLIHKRVCERGRAGREWISDKPRTILGLKQFAN